MDKRELFVKNLRKIMDIKGKTQTDIAKGMGKPLTTVSSWYNGASYPRVDAMQALADYLKVSMRDLTTAEEISTYYLDPETSKMAEEIHKNVDLKMLFDATRGMPPEDIKRATEIIKLLKDKENGEQY